MFCKDDTVAGFAPRTTKLILATCKTFTEVDAESHSGRSWRMDDESEKLAVLLERVGEGDAVASDNDVDTEG